MLFTFTRRGEDGHRWTARRPGNAGLDRTHGAGLHLLLAGRPRNPGLPHMERKDGLLEASRRWELARRFLWSGGALVRRSWAPGLERQSRLRRVSRRDPEAPRRGAEGVQGIPRPPARRQGQGGVRRIPGRAPPPQRGAAAADLIRTVTSQKY